MRLLRNAGHTQPFSSVTLRWPSIPAEMSHTLIFTISTTIVFVGVNTGKVFVGERPPRQRKTSRAEPGLWRICSGEGDQPITTGPGTYWVSSERSSTIHVEVYDSNNMQSLQDLCPDGHITINVTSGLFVGPKPPNSGTATGQWALL